MPTNPDCLTTIRLTDFDVNNLDNADFIFVSQGADTHETGS